MASLNTLRTKYGIVLSVVIALVLVAFILGDQLSMQGRQNDLPEDKAVITVNGEDIKASEYVKYQELYRDANLSADAKADLAYEYALFNTFSEEALDALGLGVSDAEKKHLMAIWTPEEYRTPKINDPAKYPKMTSSYVRGGGAGVRFNTMIDLKE